MNEKNNQIDRASIEKSVRLILDNISDSVFVINSLGAIVYLNPAAEQLNLSLHPIVGQHLRSLFPETVVNALKEDCFSACAQKKSFSVQLSVAHFHQWFDVRAFTIANDHWAVCLTSITASSTVNNDKLQEQSATYQHGVVSAASANQLPDRFRIFFERFAQFAWLITPDGQVVEVNHAALQITQTEFNQVVGKKLWECEGWNHRPASAELIQCAVSTAAAGKDFRQTQNHSWRHSGDCLLELTVTPVLDEQAAVILLAVVVIDTTEQRRLDIAFNSMRTQLESMLSAAEVATWTWDAETNQIIADRNLGLLFSVPTTKAGHASLAEYYAAIHPDDIERVKALSRKAIADGSLFESRYRVRTAEGNYRTVIARGRAQYDSNGMAVSFPGVVLDITSQAEVENELQLSNQRYSTLIDLMDEGFCTLEILYDHDHQPYDYRFIEVNQAFEKQTGLIAPVGKTARALVPNLEMGWVETYGRVANTGKPMRFQMQSIAMGRAFDVYASRQGGPESNRISLIFTDITARQFAEETLRNHANSLMESNRRKSEFLATLAHELRNPLAPLKNGVQLLKFAGNDPQTVAEVAGMMARQLNQMVRLVDDLLDIGRINSGKIELKARSVLLRKIIDSAIETSMPLMEVFHHQLTVEVHDDSMLLNADSARLAQVLSNLLNNAAKYTPPGGEIKVVSWSEGADLYIAVKDNGIGLSPDCMTSVFEMFSQVSRSQTQAQGGLGIGLSLVRQIVELHGGQVTAQSPGKDQGSTFLVRLPLTSVSLLQDRTDSSPGDSLQKDTIQLRILLVDDNIDAAESLSTLLTLIGHQTLVAGNGTEAIAIARHFIPHIAFLDLGLPGMDGCQLAQALRSIPQLQLLRLVALTGWGGKDDREKTAAAGFEEHLIKPASFAAIQRVIAKSRQG